MTGLLSSTVRLVMLRLWGMALAVLSTVLLVRTLGATSFGWFAALTTLVTLANMAADRGLTQVATRLISVKEGSPAEVVWTARRLRTRASLAWWGVLCAGFAALPGDVRPAGLIMACVVVVSAGSVWAAPLLASRRPHVVGVAAATQNLLWTLWVVAGWLMDAPLLWFACGVLTGAAANTAMLLFHTREHHGARSGVSRLLFRRSYAVAGGSLAWFAAVRLPVPLLAWVVSPAAAAPLAASLRVADGLMLVPSAAATALLPVLSRSAEQPSDGRFDVTLRAMTSFAVLMTAFVIPASPEITGVLGFADHATVLVLVVAGVVPFAVDSSVTTSLIGEGRFEPLLTTGLVAAAVSLGAVGLVGDAGGVVAAAGAVLFAQILRAGLLLGSLGRPSLAGWDRAGWRAVAVAALVAAGSLVVTWSLPLVVAWLVVVPLTAAALVGLGFMSPWTLQSVLRSRLRPASKVGQ